jgi:hypothetical protein
VVRTARRYSAGPDVQQPLADALAGLAGQLTWAKPAAVAEPTPDPQPQAEPISAPIAVYSAHHCRACRHTGLPAEHRPTDACAGHQLLDVDVTITARSQA